MMWIKAGNHMQGAKPVGVACPRISAHALDFLVVARQAEQSAPSFNADRRTEQNQCYARALTRSRMACPHQTTERAREHPDFAACIYFCDQF
jgi:hypothetical protein